MTGLLSLMLAVDDFFLIHDRFIDQHICYLAYAVCAITLLIRHYRTILEIDGAAFLMAGMFLALSILADMTQGNIPMEYTTVQIFEEGFKFIGATCWLYFNCRSASPPQTNAASAVTG